MEEVRIMILDNDKDFKYRFIHYVVNACKNVSIYTLEEAEVLAMDDISLKNNLKKCNVLVADEILNKRLSHFYDMEQFIYICLTKNNCTHITEREGKIQYIYKYQDASVILARIINICSIQNIEIKRNQSSEKLSIITVTGASGGVGKTALCLTFARLRRQLGRRNPLIIDMRSMSDHYVYFPQTEISEQEDLNFLLLDEERGTSNPEKYILRDKYGVAEFIMPQEHRSDITELNREEMRKFLERIQEWCIFDLVIFEMGNFLNDTAAYLYEISDYIFSVTDDNYTGKAAADKWEKLICKYSGNKKIIRIANFAGKERDNIQIFLDDDYIIKESENVYKLPYDPDSFFRNEGHNEISLMGRYGAAVDMLMKEAVKL